MGRRLVVPRIDGSSAPATGETKLVEAPTVSALRMVYGVGPGSGAAPDNDSFRPTYTVSLPLFSMGGLDPDGVYEFDAGLLLETIVRRSQRRQWGMRLELDLTQQADSVSLADVHVQGPFPDDHEALSLHVLGRTGQGTTLAGGGRTITVATALVHDAKHAAALSGSYEIQLRDKDPSSAEKPNVASNIRSVQVNLTRFEFEG